MYKKITHNIVEEHYDHPMAMEIKSTMNRTRTDPVIKPTASSAAEQFRTQATATWTTLGWRLRNLIESIWHDGGDIATINDQISKDIKNIRNGLTPYFTSGILSNFEIGLETLVTDLGNEIKAVKSGKDTRELESKTTAAISNLAEYLESINPKYWPKTAVVDIFTGLKNHYIDQVKFKLKRDWPSDIDSLNKSIEVLTRFADVFSSGIIKEFPGKFI
jgi:hypothetical protein